MTTYSGEQLAVPDVYQKTSSAGVRPADERAQRRAEHRLRWGRWPAVSPGESRSNEAASWPLRLKGYAGDPAELKHRTVIVFGVGAVGAVAFNLLGRLGVGTVVCVDPDQYDELSWLTQPANPADAGQPKAWVQGARVHAVNPWINVLAAVGLAQDLPLAILRRADAFLVAGDNLELLIWAGEVAAALGKPLTQGAVHGESWTAFTRGFSLRDSESACPGCSLSKAEWDGQQSIEGCAVGSAVATGAVATQTLPFVCGAAAHIAVAEVLKWLLGMSHALDGEEVAYSMLAHRFWRTKLPRSSNCRCPHRRWTLVDVPEGPGDVTLAMLAARLGERLGPVAGSPESAALLQVRGERQWVSYTLCGVCDQHVAVQIPVQRFARLGSQVGECSCGRPLLALPLASNSVIPPDDLRSCWDRPLSALGLGPGAAVGMSLGDDWTYFFIGGEPPLEAGPPL